MIPIPIKRCERAALPINRRKLVVFLRNNFVLHIFYRLIYCTSHIFTILVLCKFDAFEIILELLCRPTYLFNCYIPYPDFSSGLILATASASYLVLVVSSHSMSVLLFLLLPVIINLRELVLGSFYIIISSSE